MTVVPQHAVHLRRATKADLPAILNIMEKSETSISLVLFRHPTPLRRNTHTTGCGMTVFSRPFFFPDQVLMVAETHQRLTANSKSSQDAMTGKTKAIVGYARGSISLTSGHQPATRELESKYMEEWCVQRPYIYNWRQLPKS